MMDSATIETMKLARDSGSFNGTGCPGGPLDLAKFNGVPTTIGRRWSLRQVKSEGTSANLTAITPQR